MKKALLVLGILLTAARAGTAEEPKRDVEHHVRKATEAYQAKDYAGFLDASRSAQELLPDSPRLMYNLACAYSRNGRGDEAAAWLDRLAAMGLVYDAAADEDFAAIRDTAPFRAVTARFATNASPTHHAETVITLEEKGLIAEGVAYDPASRAFFVSSVRKRKIIRIENGKATDFVAGRDELGAAFGIRADSRRRRLWVTTGTIPQMVSYKAGYGFSGLLELDLATGALVAKHLLPGAPEAHAIADLTIDTKGNVYVSDSKTPAVYVLKRGKRDLERLATKAPFVSPQGLALSADEKKLYVADYARGVFVVDPKTLAWSKLEHPDSVCLHGIDGLASAKGALYAAQNGIRPKRVVRISLDPAGSRATRLDVLEANTPELGEPTLGTVVDGWFYFVADSGWDKVGDDGSLPPEAELRPHTVMRVK